MIQSAYLVFPVYDLKTTMDYYQKVYGFKSDPRFNVIAPLVILKRDKARIILTYGATRVKPNRELYGYGFDAYFNTPDPLALQKEFVDKGAKLIKPVVVTEYGTTEFIVEDNDGRWLAFAAKQKTRKKT